jgi:hypothetical protein
MDRPQLNRRCRIAASVFVALMAVALCLLWLRSYSWLDSWARDAPEYQHLISVRGVFSMELESRPQPGALRIPWRRTSVPTASIPQGKSRKWIVLPNVAQGGGRTYIRIPYWLATAVASALALAPVLTLVSPQRIQFTTRTLLIATTLVALVLGLGVWLAS